MKICAKAPQTKSYWTIKWFKAVFESNKCRFAKRCELYQKDGFVCNNYFERFSARGSMYCKKYRELKKDEEKK